MKLRSQLLLVSLLLLTLPWAGCQFLRETENTLRQGQQQSLEATASAVASALQNRPEVLYPEPRQPGLAGYPQRSLYASPGRVPVIMDGYGDGWAAEDYHRFHAAGGAPPLTLAYQATTRGDRLYLLLRVDDRDRVYNDPGLGTGFNGDRIVITTGQGGKRQSYVIAPVAPGSVRASFASRRGRGQPPERLRGYWQDVPGGYTVELEMPLSFTGERLGVYAVSVDPSSRETVTSAGNTAPGERALPPWLIRNPPELARALAPFAPPGSPDLGIVDDHGWLIGRSSSAEAGTVQAGTAFDEGERTGDEPGSSAVPGTESSAGGSGQADEPETFWLLRWLYRALLDQPVPPPPAGRRGQVTGDEVAAALAGRVAARWYREPGSGGRTFLSAAAPLIHEGTVIGAAVVTASTEEYLSLTDRAFGRLFALTLLALGASILGLLGYATLVSWRIRRLSVAASGAVSARGELTDNFPRSKAGDEIGELSRSFAELLDQLRAHHDYLRSLSRKLAHELRTPIAVIQSSLDNLELAGHNPADRATYQGRARDGLLRLNAILTAMSEATRLQESLRSNPLQRFDLVPVLREVFAAYRGIYPNHALRLAIGPVTAPVRGAPELLVQALDKLFDNAAAFCPPGGAIELSLDDDSGHWRLRVSNEGPPLPENLQGRLFEPMVSARGGATNEVHLGLGLHVVQLICLAFGGSVDGTDRSDGSGVVFTLRLPAAADTGPETSDGERESTEQRPGTSH